MRTSRHNARSRPFQRVENVRFRLAAPRANKRIVEKFDTIDIGAIEGPAAPLMLRQEEGAHEIRPVLPHCQSQ